MADGCRLLTGTNWTNKRDELDDLLARADTIDLQPMKSGLEASVHRVVNGNRNYVLKVWDKHSKPDIAYQYQLLRALSEHGIPVSRPLGAGVTAEGCGALLTSDDGVPLTKMDQAGIVTIAKLMADLHRFPYEPGGPMRVNQHDFVPYFFYGIEAYPDLQAAVLEWVEDANLRYDTVIHGDLHLGNIVESEGRYTAIDWTNGQLGDPRYDLMWMVVITRLYVADQIADGLLHAYLSMIEYPARELQTFEAIAFARWLLLHRRGELPADEEKVAALIRNNQLLMSKNLFPIRA